MKKRVFLLLIAFLLTPFHRELIPSSAPNQSTKEQQALQYEVTVTLKLVQVYVADRKGNPVVDLTKEEFTIYDNGKKQSVTEYEKHILVLPPAKAELQPELTQEAISAQPSELISRKFFLIFDFAYNNSRGLLKSKQAALHFINTQLQPSDEVGLLSYSASRSLTLHEYLTTNHEKIRNIVESFGLKEIAGRVDNFQDEYWRQVTGTNPVDAASSEGKTNSQQKRSTGEEEETEREVLTSDDWVSFKAKEDTSNAFGFIKKMTELAKALRYIPGYKNILLFSSGVPYSLMYGFQMPYDSWNVSKGDPLSRQKGLETGHQLLRQRYEEMLKELAASNSTIYTLDTEDFVAKIGVDSRVRGSFTLSTMASSTGGKYFGNINNYEKHLERIQNLTGCYYVLGYYIDEEWDGKYHEIKVKVNRPGCEVHAQRGFFNPKPFSQYTKLEKMLHLVDLALSEKPLFQTPVRFPLMAVPCSIKGKPNISLFSKIPSEKIRELSEKDVEIVSIIFDKDNNIAKMERDGIDFSRLPKEDVFYSSLVSLGPGDYKCRLVIRNLETGRGAVASTSITVPRPPDSGLKLYPPVFLKPEKGVYYVKALAVAYPFDLSRYCPVIEDVDQGTKSLLAFLRCSYSGIQRPEVKLYANLIYHLSGTGIKIPLSISIIMKYQQEKAEEFLVELQTGALQPGEYFLHFFAEDTNTKSLSQVSTAFTVKK